MPIIVEGFAVETTDGLIFTVKGLLHPPDRVIAYLRYVPDPHGNRQRSGRRYRRLYHFEEQEALLRARYPEYLAHDPVFGARLQSVPRGRVRSVYDPCRHLEVLHSRGINDPVERDALHLATLLQEAANVSWADVGISGSVLIGLQRPDSDIDLIIYGEEAGGAVHRALQGLLERSTTPLRRPGREELASLHSEHRADTPLAFDDFARLQARKVNELRFRGREAFIRFVKRPAESQGRYGSQRFESLGTATVRARVTDDRDAIFTPCRYLVDEASLLDGSSLGDLRSLVSFRGRFSDQARVGEWIEARGNLERVTPLSGAIYQRLIVGGCRGDYMSVRWARD
jgi:predicted nucleotidyltransferase